MHLTGGRDAREEMGDGAQWWSLQRDVFGKCTAYEFPGSLLICMAIEPQDEMQSRDITAPRVTGASTAAAAKPDDPNAGTDLDEPDVEWEAFAGMGEGDFDGKLREVKSKILKTQKSMKKLSSKATARLSVRVKKATDLKDVEMFQSMDPYGRVQVCIKNDELCIKYDQLCIKNALKMMNCINNDELCINDDEL